MSAPTPRGRGGHVGSRGASFRGAPSNRGSTRGRGAPGVNRGSGSFRGARSAASTTTTTATNGPQGLLQQMRSGAVNRGAGNGNIAGVRGRGTTRASFAAAGRGRDSGFLSKSFGNKATGDNAAADVRRPSSPFGAADTSEPANVEQRYKVLKNLREEERRDAIRMGFLADPEKKTTLDKAITPVGTCKEMCPPYERVERIVQMMVDRSEKVVNPSGGRPVASEEIMVKRFRRSAAGDDEQIPSDIRTPETLRKTLDYLVDKLVGGPERLAVVHKFVWDRTRAIRNDFSIQQVSKEEDVRIAVECFERIARFHIIALHQLSNPENLHEGENFDVFQEREQLNNTLLSLMYYYDDHRGQISFPNEAEFRAYHIILAFQSQHPDIEDRVQSWPMTLLADSKIQTALRLYQAAGNTLFDQGPLRPMTPFPVAQNDSGRFWTLMNSGAVSYTLACVTELYFSQIRFGALSSLWRSCKSAPAAQQAKLRDWTTAVVTEYLGFDEGEQTADFCGEFGLTFQTDDQGVTYLDLAANSDKHLDQSAIPKEIVFSQTFVEDKRCRRTLMAVINNVRPADAIRQGMVEEGDAAAPEEVEDDGEGLFIPENKPAERTFGQGAFNPEASSFKLGSTFGSTPLPSNSIFGRGASASPVPAQPSSSFGSNPVPPNSIFGKGASGSASSSQPAATTFSGFGDQSGQQTGFGFSQQTRQSREDANNAFSSGVGLSQGTTGSTPAGGQEAGQPRWITQWGQSRPSVEDNNPFGPKPTGQFGKPESTPSQSAPASSGSMQSQPSNGFSLGIFGIPTSKPGDASPVSPFTTAKPAAPDSTQAASPFPGFQFAKPDSPAAVTTSSAQQTAAPFFSTTPSSSPQQALPTFSFTAQSTDSPQSKPPSETAQPSQPPPFAFPKNVDFQFPKAESHNTTRSLSSQAAESTAQKPLFNFTPPVSTAATDPELKNAAGIQATFNTGVDPLKAPQDSGQTTFTFPAAASEQSKPPAQSPLSGFKSATVSDPTPADTTPTQPTFTFPSTAQKSPDSPAPTQQFQSTTPPHSPPRKQPQLPKVNKDELIEHVTRLALTQPHGLIQSYLEWCLPTVLQRVQTQYEEELRQEALDRLKQSYLFRKYGGIWRSIAWRSNLNKKASKRRHLLSTSLKMEALKKQRQEEELKAIIAAVEETRRLKAEAQRKSDEAKSAEGKVQPNRKMEPIPLAGNKRKSLGETVNGVSPATGAGKTSQYLHKRSRTVGSMLSPAPPPPKAASTSSPSQFRHSIFSGRASLGRSSSSTNLRLSDIRPKQDRTRSPYFDLLARGIDPETPEVPLTARQVEAKRRREDDERQAKIAAAHNRRLVGRAATRQSPAATPSISSEAKAPSIANAATPPSPPVSAPSPQPWWTGSSYNPEADEYLQELRAAREDLEKESKWFQEQSELMKKEVEEQEKFRSSNSSHGSPVAYQNGYGQRNFSPKSSLSRVEQALQRRGGSRLANYEPLKGSNYQPVPMSKRSAQIFAQQADETVERVVEIETNGTAKKRRKRGNIDPSYRPGKDELLDDDDLNFSPQKRTKKHAAPSRLAKAPAKVVSNAQFPQSAVQNKFASLQGLQKPDEVDLTADEEDEEDLGGYEGYFNNGATAGAPENPFGGGQDSEDELLEDPDPSESGYADANEYDDEDELLDEDEDEAGSVDYDYVRPSVVNGRLMQQGVHDDEEGDEYSDEDEDEEDRDAPTPNTLATTSRATSSGPGATVGDAIALSDSD